MGIRLQSVRVKGFRGFRNIEVDFENTNVLVGTNNAGKTTLLKALQLALTNSHFISNDDFFYCDEHRYSDPNHQVFQDNKANLVHHLLNDHCNRNQLKS